MNTTTTNGNSLTQKKNTTNAYPLRQVSSENLSYDLPAWYERLRPSLGDALVVPEWQDEDSEYREQNGWKGRDLIHDPTTSAIYVPQYFVQYGTHKELPRGGVGTTLTALAYFSERAESHRGYCHGGSMCSVMDDVIGWVAFCVTGEYRPWSGFTVQINTNLQKPIPVYSVLMIVGQVTRMERRKVFVEARLIDPSNDNAQHARAEGIVVLNRGVLPPALESQVSDVSME